MADKLLTDLEGGSIGIAVGILYAPRSGSQTREILQGKVKEGREYIRKEANDFRDRASALVEKGSDAPKAQVGVAGVESQAPSRRVRNQNLEANS